MFDRNKYYIKNREKIKNCVKKRYFNKVAELKREPKKFASYLKKNAIKERKRRKTMQELINELKINGCSICGYNKYHGSLDFHHVEKKYKKFTINQSQIILDSLTEEVAKCILLCKNCHYEIHSIKGA